MVVPGMPVADQKRPEACAAGPDPSHDLPGAVLVHDVDLDALALRGAAKGLRGGRAVGLIGLRGVDPIDAHTLSGSGLVFYDDRIAASNLNAVDDVIRTRSVVHGSAKPIRKPRV
jgi:hypothetical protein